MVEPAVVSNVVDVPERSPRAAEHNEPASEEPARVEEATAEEVPADEPTVAAVATGSASVPTIPPPPVPRDPAAMAAARTLFQRGVVAYQAGRYADAKREFEAAYYRVPMPQVLFNLAMAEMQLGDQANACLHYVQWMRQTNPSASRLQSVGPQFAGCIVR